MGFAAGQRLFGEEDAGAFIVISYRGGGQAPAAALPGAAPICCLGRSTPSGGAAAISRAGSTAAKLLVAVGTPTGVVTGFVVAPANTEERWVADALLGWRADPHAAPLHGGRRLALAEIGDGRAFVETGEGRMVYTVQGRSGPVQDWTKPSSCSRPVAQAGSLRAHAGRRGGTAHAGPRGVSWPIRASGAGGGSSIGGMTMGRP